AAEFRLTSSRPFSSLSSNSIGDSHAPMREQGSGSPSAADWLAGWAPTFRSRVSQARDRFLRLPFRLPRAGRRQGRWHESAYSEGPRTLEAYYTAGSCQQLANSGVAGHYILGSVECFGPLLALYPLVLSKV